MNDDLADVDTFTRYSERWHAVTAMATALRDDLLNQRDITELDRNQRQVIADKLDDLAAVAEASAKILRLVDR